MQQRLATLSSERFSKRNQVPREKGLVRRCICSAITWGRLLPKSVTPRTPKKRVKPLRLAGRRAIRRGLRETCLAIGVSRHKHLCRRLWTLYACGYAKRRDRRIRPARTLLDKLLLDA